MKWTTKDSGVLVATEGLAFPDQAMIVRAGSDGEPITDGVFQESKEFLAGYWIIDVESPSKLTRSPHGLRRRAGPEEARQHTHRSAADF